MLVFAGQRYGNRVFVYYRTVRWLHVALVGVLLVPTALGFAFLEAAGQHELAVGLMGVAVSIFSVLLFYLYRRLCYAIDRVEAAAASGAVYLVCLLTVAGLLYRADRLGVFSAYLALSISALVSTVALHLFIWPSGGAPSGPPSGKQILIEHFSYGRWSLGAAILIWLPSNVYYMLLPRVWGLQASGALKALMNLAMPMIQANLALGNNLLGSLARVADDSELLRQHFRGFVRWVIFACLAYWLLVGLLAEPLIRLLYGGRYLEHAYLAWHVGLVPLVMGLALAERSVFQAVLRPDLVFRGNAVGATLSVVVGVSLVYYRGLEGAMISMILSYAAMFLWLRRDPRRPVV